MTETVAVDELFDYLVKLLTLLTVVKMSGRMIKILFSAIIKDALNNNYVCKSDNLLIAKPLHQQSSSIR